MNDTFFATLVDSLPAGVVLLEQANGHILYMNPRAVALLGADGRHWAGASFTACFPEVAHDWMASLGSADASVDVQGPLEGQIFALTAFDPAAGHIGLLIHDVSARCDRADPRTSAPTLLSGGDKFMGRPYAAVDLSEGVEGHHARVGALVGDDRVVATMGDDVAQPASVEVHLATLDTSLIDELREALGDDLNEIFDQFLFQLDDQLQLLGGAIAATEAQQIRECAHALKGSAGSLGVSGLAGIAAEIETMAREGDLVPVAEAFDRAQRCAAQTVVILGEMGFSAREV